MTRTPPALKWLTDKRARLQGKLEHNTRMLALATARLGPKVAKLRVDVEALDRAIGVYDRALDGSDITSVNPWQGNYGPRGALKEFVRDVLRQRAPTSIRTDDLATLILERFAITFDLPAMHRRWTKNTVLGSLRMLVKEGLVEPLHEGKSGFVGEWRWKQSRRPTLADLRAAAPRGDEAGRGA